MLSTVMNALGASSGRTSRMQAIVEFLGGTVEKFIGALPVRASSRQKPNEPRRSFEDEVRMRGFFRTACWKAT
jgi:hypothetical protein